MISLYQPNQLGSMGFTLTVPNDWNANSPDEPGLLVTEVKGRIFKGKSLADLIVLGEEEETDDLSINFL